MHDTTTEMLQKQREIFFAKSSKERFLIASDLINFGRLMLENSIKQKFPKISELDLKIKSFKRYYEKSFNKKEFDKIILAMKQYHHNLENQTKPTI